MTIVVLSEGAVAKARHCKQAGNDRKEPAKAMKIIELEVRQKVQSIDNLSPSDTLSGIDCALGIAGDVVRLSCVLQYKVCVRAEAVRRQ
jgi:hypothetical protein